MKSTPLFVALLFTLLLLAVGTLATPKESDYPIKVQVTSSQYAAYPDSQSQVLVVITDGKRYSLAGPTGDGLLALGGVGGFFAARHCCGAKACPVTGAMAATAAGPTTPQAK